MPPRSKEAMQRMYEGQRKGRTAPSNLREFIHPEMYPSPTSTDYKGAPSLGCIDERAIASSRGVSLPEHVAKRHRDDVGCYLNPNWVEALMGMPQGWTQLAPLDNPDWDYSWQSWEPDIPRVRKDKDRTNRLKGIGNAQVPLCMAIAWESLHDKH